jgi:hypothetical protein
MTRKDFEMSTEKYAPTQGAVVAGLMYPYLSNGEPCLTDAGLFALAGMMAYSGEDDEPRQHCLTVFVRVMNAARASGLDALAEKVVTSAFSAQINPADGSESGNALAELCRYVSEIVGPGRMLDLIEGRKAH